MMQIKHNMNTVCGLYLPKALLPKSQGSLRAELQGSLRSVAFLYSPSTFSHDSTLHLVFPCVPSCPNLKPGILTKLITVASFEGCAHSQWNSPKSAPTPRIKHFVLLLKLPDHPSLTLEPH